MSKAWKEAIIPVVVGVLAILCTYLRPPGTVGEAVGVALAVLIGAVLIGVYFLLAKPKSKSTKIGISAMAVIAAGGLTALFWLTVLKGRQDYEVVFHHSALYNSATWSLEADGRVLTPAAHTPGRTTLRLKAGTHRVAATAGSLLCRVAVTVPAAPQDLSLCPDKPAAAGAPPPPAPIVQLPRHETIFYLHDGARDPSFQIDGSNRAPEEYSAGRAKFRLAAGSHSIRAEYEDRICTARFSVPHTGPVGLDCNLK